MTVIGDGPDGGPHAGPREGIPSDPTHGPGDRSPEEGERSDAGEGRERGTKRRAECGEQPARTMAKEREKARQENVERDKRYRAERLARMSPEEREEARRKQSERKKRWRAERLARMSAEEREEARRKEAECDKRCKAERLARMSAEEREEVRRKNYERDRRVRAERLARMSAEEREDFKSKRRDHQRKYYKRRLAQMSTKEREERVRKQREYQRNYQRRHREENRDRLRKTQIENTATSNRNDRARMKREREEPDEIDSGAASRAHSTKAPSEGIVRREDGEGRASGMGLGHRESKSRADGPGKNDKDSSWNPFAGRANQSREAFEAITGGERAGQRREEWDALVCATMAAGAGQQQLTANLVALQQQQAATAAQLQQAVFAAAQDHAAAQQHPAAAAPLQQPAAPTPASAATHTNFLMRSILEQQNTTALILQQLQAKSGAATTSKPSATFPKWDGKRSTLAKWAQLVEVYKLDPYFASVTDWTKTTPGSLAQSQTIYDALLENLPAERLHHFVNSPAYTGRGIEMLEKILSIVRPDAKPSRMDTVRDLINTVQRPCDNTSEFLSKMRGFAASLRGATIDDLIPLFALVNMDQERYDGTVFRYLAADPVVVNATIDSLEGILDGEDERKKKSSRPRIDTQQTTHS